MEKIPNTNILEAKAVSAKRLAMRGVIALAIQFRGMIIALFGFSVTSWAVVKSGVAQIATPKISNALEMSEMITIVLNVMTVIMANTCGEILAMQRTLEQILTQRAYVVMNTNVSRKVKTLGNALTVNIALPRHHTKWHSVQRRATPTVRAGQTSKIVKKISPPKKKYAECTSPQDVAPVKKCKLIVGGKKSPKRKNILIRLLLVENA